MNSSANASPSGSQSPAKLGLNSTKRGSFSTVGRFQQRRSISKRPEKIEKNDKKEDNSARTQELLRKMRFYVKVYLALWRTKETVDKLYEEMNPGYKQVRKALQANYRPGSEAKRILTYLRNLPFFNGFVSKFCCDVDDVALVELCKRLKYECYIPGVFLFREGDPTDEKFYIVFRGSLETIKKPKENIPYIEDQHLQSMIKRDVSDRDSTPRSAFRNSQARDSPRYSQYYNDNRTRHKSIHFGFRFRHSFVDTLSMTIERQITDAGERQKEIKRGESLGELALTDNEPIKRYSALTTTNCEFLVLYKKDYQEIVKKFSCKKMRKGEFMETRIPFLDSIVSPEVWDVLHDSLVEVEYPKGAIVATEKTEGSKLYFIQQGECVLEKNITLPPRNDKHEIDAVRAKKVIAALGEGSCIGAEIVFSDEQLYTYTIKVKSSTVMLYAVEKATFLRNFPQQCIEALHENMLIKEQLHEKKIQRIVQEAIEEANAENNILKPLLKASSSLSPTNFRIHPTLYNHMHTPQHKKSENIVVMDQKESVAKSFEHEAMLLFPKEEKTFEKVKSKSSSMFKKRANIATANGTKRKGITDFLEDPNVVNPHVLMQRSKVKDLIKSQSQEKHKVLEKSMEKDKKLPAIAWSSSPKAKEIQNHYQSLKPLKTIESMSNVEENQDHLLNQLKISSTRIQKSDTTNCTLDIYGEKADFISSRISSKQQKRLFSHNTPSLSEKTPTKLTIRLNHDSFLNLRRKESLDSPALSVIENWKDKSIQDNKEEHLKSEPSSPISAIKPIIGQESGRSAIKSFAKVLKKTFSTHQSTDSLGASPLINIATQKKLMQHSRDEASESMDNTPAATFSAGLKQLQSNSLNVSQEISHIGTSYRKIRASPAGNSFFQSSPIVDVGLFKSPVILCKQKRKIMGKSISTAIAPFESMMSKTPTGLKSFHGEGVLKIAKVMK